MTQTKQEDLQDTFGRLALHQSSTNSERTPVISNETDIIEDFLPARPEEPLQSDCCGNGCTPCVVDLYQEELEKWQTLSGMTLEERVRWLKKQEEAGRSAADSTSVLKALSQTECREFTLEDVVRLTRDSNIFTFSLPPNHSLGLQVGQHIVLRVYSNGETVSRQYTPISTFDQQGSFSVLIKCYDDGKMSQFVREWRVGNAALWKGPFGGFPYSQNKYERIGLLACGTGIAPMVQLIRTVVENEKENTFVHLVYSCRTQHDILMKTELEHFALFWNFTALYVLTRSSEESVRSDAGCVRYGDKIHFGRIDQELVCSEMPPPSNRRNQVLICGTESFDTDMKDYLAKAGYSNDTYFKF